MAAIARTRRASGSVNVSLAWLVPMAVVMDEPVDWGIPLVRCDFLEDDHLFLRYLKAGATVGTRSVRQLLLP